MTEIDALQIRDIEPDENFMLLDLHYTSIAYNIGELDGRIVTKRTEGDKEIVEVGSIEDFQRIAVGYLSIARKAIMHDLERQARLREQPRKRTRTKNGIEQERTL